VIPINVLQERALYMIFRQVLAVISVFFVASACPALLGATWYVDDSVALPGDGTSWLTAFRTIQKGIDEASSGDTVMVAPGTYYENIQFGGKNIVLQSTDPDNADTVSRTIIDAFGSGTVVTFSGSESAACEISGFTIRNGMVEGVGGAGIRGKGTHATISKNVITNNQIVGVNNRGGGIAYCHGIIRDNIIEGNSSGDQGAGLYNCDGIIESNIVHNNTAYRSGGGLSYCDGIIQLNVIQGNHTDWSGGGLYYCQGDILGNTIHGNSASEDGGGLAYCDGLIQNNTIAENSAAHGGGLRSCNGTVRHNLIRKNTAGSGGGLGFCEGIVEGNEIRENSASYGGGLRSCSAVIRGNQITHNVATSSGGAMFQCHGTVHSNLIYANESDQYGGAARNCNATFTNNTIFLNSAKIFGVGLSECEGPILNCIIWGNWKPGAPGEPQLHLCTSPTFSCIEGWTEGGQGNIASNPLFSDAAGGDFRLREDSPCIDRGKNEAWMWDALDLDENPRIFYGGISATVDMGAYEYGSFPFQITGIGFVTIPFPGGTRLTWNSRPGDSYSVWSRDSLFAEWTQVATVESQGITTSHTISGLFPILLRTRFYRVQLVLQ
jgi:hypothetical protein